MRKTRNEMLQEAVVGKHAMFPEERRVRKALCELLVRNKHPKYAKRLAMFDFNIVPVSEEPDFTAAISFDEGVVFVSEGFLNNENTFFQLDVLMRHELAHNLLMHQIRMMDKVGKIPGSHIRRSQSLHTLFNVIEDYEISNKVYTEKDKIIVRNMVLNGRVIGGLVTEDDYPNWQDMSVEQMYDELTKEIDAINAKILATRDLNSAVNGTKLNAVTVNIFKAYQRYNDTKSPSSIGTDINEFITESQDYANLPDSFKYLIKDLADDLTAIKNNSFANDEAGFVADCEKIMESIAKSKPFEYFELTDMSSGELFKSTDPEGTGVIKLYTPEEKGIAIDVIKNIMGNWVTIPTIKVKRAQHSQEYKDVYNAIIKNFDDATYSDQDLTDIVDICVKKGII